MIKKQIEALAVKTICEMGNIFHDPQGAFPIAQKQVQLAIEEAIGTLPVVEQSLIDNLDRILADRLDAEYFQEADTISAAIALLKPFVPLTPKPYTVILIVPEYAADNYGQDTWLDHVEALDIDDAVRLARKNAWKSHEVDPDGEDFNPDCFNDYKVAMVCEGHIQDIFRGE